MHATRFVTFMVLLGTAVSRAEAQGLSVDPLSPEVPGVYSAADYVADAPTLPPAPAGPTAAALGLLASDNIDAMSAGIDNIPITFAPGHRWDVVYSVTRATAGAGGVVSTEVSGNGAAGDEFLIYISGTAITGPSRRIDSPFHGAPCSPLPGESDVDALDAFLILPALYFSLDPPSAAGMGISPADILYQPAPFLGAPPSLFASAGDLGLFSGDVIDALALADAGPPGGTLGELDAGDTVYVSLAPGSPTLGLLGASPGDVIEVFPGLAVVISAASLDLLASDDLNAMSIPDPTQVPWCDTFDYYANASGLHGQGGWRGWDDDPAFDAVVTNVQARSAPHSVDITGNADILHEFSGADSGQWVFTAWQYIPLGFFDPGSQPFEGSYFILYNTYNDGGPYVVGASILFDSNDGMAKTGYGIEVPYVTDQWVEIRVVIDLDTDWTQIYYDDTLITEYAWTPGALNIAAADLYANGSTSVYWDDLLLETFCQPSDANCDGSINVLDIPPFIEAMLGSPSGCSPCQADTDGDGSINGRDIQPFVDRLMGP